MFLDFSNRKFAYIVLIIAALVGSILLFLTADKSFALVSHSEEYVTMNQSSLWYWLRYNLTGNTLSSYASVPEPDGGARSVPVLLYHGEGATSGMPFSVFVDQLRALKAAGWHTITMKEFDAFIEGSAPLPQKSFLLTFDDGRKDTYYQADPVLKDLGFNAVMFVITGFSLPAPGKKDSQFYLNKTELGDMVASGRWELESHGNQDHGTYAVESTTDLSKTATTTEGHFLSNKFWNEGANAFESDADFASRVRADLVSSKEALESTFGITVNSFAYPFNDFGQNTVNFPGSEAILDGIVPSVYQFAFYQTWPTNGDTFNYPGINNGLGSSGYMIKRIEPKATWSGTDLLSILNTGYAKPLPYESSSFGTEWVDTWGAATGGTSLSLAASPTTSGASAFLNGSGWWTNYLIRATATLHTGTVSLLARNQSDSRYVACTFDQNGASIQVHSGSTPILLASSHAAPGTGAVTLGMAVFGTMVVCYENGNAVVSAEAPNAPSQGGIGFEVWDRALGSASASVQHVSVKTLVSIPQLPAKASARRSSSPLASQERATNAAAQPVIQASYPLSAAPLSQHATGTVASSSRAQAATSTPPAALPSLLLRLFRRPLRSHLRQ
jgi:peptidoglycan/xylan/chitin deacetylase (PgdA/CDA1 family)